MCLQPALGSPQRNRGHPRVCVQPVCNPDFSWESAGNILNSIRVYRKTICVFYLNYQNEDKSLQNHLWRTFHVSTGKVYIHSHPTVRLNRFNLHQQILCSNPAWLPCAFQFSTYLLWKKSWKNLSPSFPRQSIAHSLHPLLKIVSVSISSASQTHPHASESWNAYFAKNVPKDLLTL